MAKNNTDIGYGPSKTSPQYNPAIKNITGQVPRPERQASTRRLFGSALEKARLSKYIRGMSSKRRADFFRNATPETIRRAIRSHIMRHLAQKAKKRLTTPTDSGSSVRGPYTPYLFGDRNPESGETQIRTTRATSARNRKSGSLDTTVAAVRGVNRVPGGTAALFPRSKKGERKREREIAAAEEAHRRRQSPKEQKSFKQWSRQFKEAYYYVLDYLLSEGYADNYEDADGIFQVMSEEWFADILEI